MPESSEKIGDDILGGVPSSRMPPKKRRELEERLKKALEEKKRKEQEEEDNIKLPKLPIPGDQHELSPIEIAEIEQRARVTGLSFEHEKDVYVQEHVRSKPKKKKKSPLADTVINFHKGAEEV
jgi:hypothetical protein